MRPFLAGAPLALLCLLAAVCSPKSPATPADGAAAALFRDGVTFQAFLKRVERRVDTWEGNYRRGEADPALVVEAGGIPGQWRLLVVAEDWCGDSANTVPYVARLDEALENLEVRVVNSVAGRGVMEAHPTPDGRAATPTMILLGPDGEEAGCLVEQPQLLQRWWLGDARAIEDEEARLAEKYAWYDRDAGASVTREVVDLMRRAAAGSPVCRSGVPKG